VAAAGALALAAAMALVGCASARDRVQIANLKQGLMRASQNGVWEVYQEGSRFNVAENGQCVVDSKTTSCMWFGLAFDYTAPSARTTLKCTWTSREPIVSVTPTQVLERDITEEQVELVLEQRRGHQATPNYVEAPWRGGETHLKYECSDRAGVVLSVTFELVGSA
jgi:hypothetical protein